MLPIFGCPGNNSFVPNSPQVLVSGVRRNIWEKYLFLLIFYEIKYIKFMGNLKMYFFIITKLLLNYTTIC